MIKLYSVFVGLVVLISFLSFKKANSAKINKKPFIVVLDAGHGGHDSGNRGNSYREKDIALSIVLKTGAILEKDSNIKVIYTRKTDKFIDLFVRGDIANKAKADLFVSVHCNAHRTQAQGTETFVLGLHANERNFKIAKKENSVILLEDNYKKNYDGFNPNSPESVIGLTLMQEEYLDQSLVLAGQIQQSFTQKLKRTDRGVKQAGFIVLHRTFMPSVLVEVGFLTNRSEGKYLNSNKGKQDMATSISNAIFNYKNSVVGSFETTEIKTVTTIKIPSTKAPVNESKKSKNFQKAKTVKQKAKKAPIVDFRVQLAVSSRKTEALPANFKGLEKVYFKREDSVYKYFVGSETNYKAIKKIKELAVKKGYNSCFIVAYKGDRKISLSEALELN